MRKLPDPPRGALTTGMTRTRTSPFASLAAALLVASLAACSAGTSSSAGSTPGADSSTDNAASTVADSETTTSTVDDDSWPLPVLAPPSTTASTTTDAPAPAPPAPRFEPVELVAVEGPAPSPAPPTPAAPVDLVATPVVIGDLTSNSPGCASNCITSAALSPGAVGSPASIEMSTNVATRMTLWMSTKSIGQSADGNPAFAGSPAPVASSAAFRRAWTAQVDDLLPNHRYRAILRVVDRFGNERFLTGEIHTPHSQASGDLAVIGGCSYQCITSGVVQHTTDYDRVSLVVSTDVPTRLAVYMSTSAPGWIGGLPVLPVTARIDTPSELSTNWSIPVDGLAGDTVYHVIVKAQDSEGHIAHRVGQFRTAPQPPTLVQVTIERIYLTNDGDPGAANRGEVFFVWGGLRDIEGGSHDPGREDTGFELVPREHQQWTVTVEPGATLPRFGATAWEIDREGVNEPSCWSTYSLNAILGQQYIDLCDARGNGVYAAPMTVADLADLQRCSSYGFIEGENDACLLVSTSGGNENYAQIKVLISYETL